ncbi:MAG: hypothetical protein QXL97_01285, partial [Candidatus Aenigmatarchaeota archaeon]
DSPYADLNNDNFQDFPIRRLCCSVEEISLQTEAKRLSKLNKSVLIAQSYLDIVNESDISELFLKSGFMHFVLEIKNKLKNSDYTVNRITEKRFTSDDLLELINKLKESIFSEETLSFPEALSFLRNIVEISGILTRLFFEIETNPIKILEPINSTNLIKYLNNSSILFILTPTYKEKYLLPTNKTYKEEIEAEKLPFVEIVFDASINNFENTLPYIKSFTKIGYKNHTTLISASDITHIFSRVLEYNYTLSKSFKEAINSERASLLGINPAQLIYIFSDEYKKKIEDWLHSIVFIGESFKIINESKPLYYTKNYISNPKIKLSFNNICSIINFAFNNTNYTSFTCNYTNVYFSNFSILYVLQEKIELPQFKSLKNYNVNYSFIVLNETFPLPNLTEFYSLVLVNNTNDIQEIYLNIYPATFNNNKTILLKDFEIELIYNDSFKVIDIYSIKDKVYIDVYSNVPRKIYIEIFKENKSVLKEEKEVYDNSKLIYILDEGKYLVKVKYFEIEYQKEVNITKSILEIPIAQKIFSAAEYFLRIFESFFKKEREFINSSLYTYSLEYPGLELKIENSNIYLRGIDFEYQKIIDFSEEIEKLKTPYGYLEIKIKDGNYYEFFEGNHAKLKEKLYKVKNDLKKILENIKNNS